jgi:eukaryotic-like serine/threonine-protein kinase
MTPAERWRKLEEVYHGALACADAERPTFIDAACGGDAELRGELLSLLARASRADAFLEPPPPLASGSRFGTYEIEGLIGSGGMGEVYRARDSKLGRDVAIKVLPEIFTRDPGRRARFDREAHVLATLNHPHIGAIYGIEDVGPRRGLILELVDGPTLADRLRRGPLPIHDALSIASQIADALAAAHERGIVHRDLKPANIKLTSDGNVKVLDFGLAKLKTTEPSSVDVSQSPTIAAQQTQDGVVLGTAAYMSPEQARGQPVDTRADIWAFGCVLYEMLTGRCAFAGASVTDTLAAVIEREPDWERLGEPTAIPIRRLLRRCLAKDLRARLRDITDARLEILDVADELPAAAQSVATRSEKRVGPTAATKRRLWMLVAAGMFFFGTVSLGLLVMSRGRTQAPAPVRFTVSAPESAVLDLETTGFFTSISPDGRHLAFSARDAAGTTSLWVRSLDALTAQLLPGTQDANAVFWSPDSRWVGFAAHGKLKKIDTAGGPPQILCDAPNLREGSWSPDGVIIFSRSSTPLSRVSAAGGAPAPLTKLTATQRAHRYPALLPDRRHFIYSAIPLQSGGATTEIFLGSFDSEDASFLVSADSPALFSPPGYLLFARQAVLLAQRFDLKTFGVTGEAVPIADQVLNTENSLAAAVSANGTLTYVAQPGNQADLQLTWVDRTGKVVDTIGPRASYRGVEVSPGEKTIAVHRHEGAGGDIWLLEANRPISRLTFEPSQDNSNPIWSPDGTRIAFGSLRAGKWGIYQKVARGAGKEQLLLEVGLNADPMSWSPDGRFLVYRTSSRNRTNYSVLPLTGDRRPFPIADVSGGMPQISPDGKWIAYASGENGRREVYVRPFPTGAGYWQITTDGASQASVRWRGDSKELFYISADEAAAMMAVPVTTSGSAFQWGMPTKLFDSGYRGIGAGHSYHDFSVSRDGQRFLIPRANQAVAQTSAITVVLNWIEELKQRVTR